MKIKERFLHFTACLVYICLNYSASIFYQNRCATAVASIFDYSVSVSYIIRTLGWMKIKERFLHFTACLVYICLNYSASIFYQTTFNI